MKRYLSLIISVMILILEALPFGAVLNFGNPEGRAWRYTYSYFDMTPFGYANFAPFITACLSVVILMLCVMKRGMKTAFVLSLTAAAVSVMPVVMFGIEYFSVTGGFITLLLVIEAIIIYKRR